jgi:hypothetical protein
LHWAVPTRCHAETTSPENACAGMSFFGDGQYIGDGGAPLELLWVSSNWKEIRNCPGVLLFRNDNGF